MVDQNPISHWSQVGFMEAAKPSNECNRRILTTVKLFMHVSRKTEGSHDGPTGSSYKVPTTNMAATPNFFFVLIFSPLSCQSGMASIQKSTMMEMAALDHARLFTLMQDPWASPLHFFQ